VGLYSIYDIPFWGSLLLIVGLTLAVGWAGLFAMRRWVSHLHREENHNEVVSYFLAAVALYYGVMVGLIAVGVWQQYSAADDKVSLEAASLAALYRDVSAFPEPNRTQLQADLREYTLNVIQKSWPLQRKRIIPTETNAVLWRFQDHLLAFQPTTNAQNIILAESFRTYNTLVELRRARQHSVQGGLPAVVWIVIVVGAVITLSVGWFFETTTFAVHFWMVTLAASLLGLIVWLLVMMDNPFLGDVSIGPAPFEQVYATIMARPR
jgi:hypothetical protein